MISMHGSKSLDFSMEKEPAINVSIFKKYRVKNGEEKRGSVTFKITGDAALIREHFEKQWKVLEIGKKVHVKVQRLFEMPLKQQEDMVLQCLPVGLRFIEKEMTKISEERDILTER